MKCLLGIVLPGLCVGSHTRFTAHPSSLKEQSTAHIWHKTNLWPGSRDSAEPKACGPCVQGPEGFYTGQGIAHSKPLILLCKRLLLCTNTIKSLFKCFVLFGLSYHGPGSEVKLECFSEQGLRLHWEAEFCIPILPALELHTKTVN